MRKFLRLLLCLFLVSGIFSCKKEKTQVSEETSQITETGEQHGFFADEIIYSIFTDEAIGLQQVVNGTVDMLYSGTPAVLINGLRKVDMDRINMYAIPSSALSLWINPIPNKAPYTIRTSFGQEIFNPLAITEVRYALNFLIDRKKIIDDILFGFGKPMFSMFVSDMPGTYKYRMLDVQSGIPETGDFELARQMITEALQRASELPENRGKLLFNDYEGWWEYNGEALTIKFYIRSDDPNIRLLIGREIAWRLEACGLKVDRMEWSATNIGTVYAGQPERYLCTLYTEAWDSVGTGVWHDSQLCSMGAPFYGNMPGGGDPNAWQYKNEAIDTLGKRGLSGQYLDPNAYWAGNLEMHRRICNDAIRIWIAEKEQLFISNKSRIENKLLYGMEDGFNMFSVRTAQVKPDKNKKKILRIGQFSADNMLVMSPWNPIGLGGFNDSLSLALLSVLSDSAQENHPVTAVPTPLYMQFFPEKLRVSPKLIEKGGESFLSGDLAVSLQAEKYDTKTKSWRAIPAGTTCAVESVSKLDETYWWHSGVKMSTADIRYAMAFEAEWAAKDSADDPYYDAVFARQKAADCANNQGFFIDANDYIHYFSNGFFAADQTETMSRNLPTAKAGNPGKRSVVPWEIYEACAEMAVNGAASGTKWSVHSGDEYEIDLLNKKCVSDILAKLKEFVETKHIPNALKGYITITDALARYNASISFIEKNHHAYISNGPGIIRMIDTEAHTIQVVPFEQYPRKASYFLDNYTARVTKINDINAPAVIRPGDTAVFTISVSQFSFPDQSTMPASHAKVTLNVQLPDGSEKVYNARIKSDGIYEAVIPGEMTSVLGKGDFLLVALSSSGDEAPSAKILRFHIE